MICIPMHMLTYQISHVVHLECVPVCRTLCIVALYHLHVVVPDCVSLQLLLQALVHLPMLCLPHVPLTGQLMNDYLTATVTSTVG